MTVKGAVCWPLRPALGSKSSRKEHQGPSPTAVTVLRLVRRLPPAGHPRLRPLCCPPVCALPCLPQDVKAAQDADGAGLSGWRQPRTGARRATGSAESPPAQLLTGLLCSEAHGRPRRGPRFSCSLGLCAHVLNLTFHRCFLLPLHALPLCFLPFTYI